MSNYVDYKCVYFRLFISKFLMLKLTITVITFILITTVASGQNLYYEIVKGNSTVGSLEIIQEVDQLNNTVNYNIKNLVEIKVLLTFAVEYVISETFTDGILTAGKGHNTLNGVSQKETSISYTNGKYHLIIDGVEGNNETRPIKESMAQIYHNELHDGKKVYSQYFGRYLTAKKVGEHKYALQSPDGENLYTYSGGYCSEVKVTRDFATFYIRLKPESVSAIKALKAKKVY